MYVLTVIAVLHTGAFVSLDKFLLYNTEQTCQANVAQQMEHLTKLLRDANEDILTVRGQCVMVIPALEVNPYEKGA